MSTEHLRDALRPTEQSRPLDDRQQKNRAGGYVYSTGDLERLRRFLVLGSEGGTYYAGQRELTDENVATLRRLVASGDSRVVGLIAEVSEGGLAPKNDGALLALALASAEGDEPTRRAAYNALPRVARTGTHLFQWMAYRDLLAGWGRGATRAVAQWYEGKDPRDLAYQMVKYRQREGWTHADALRTAHPGAPSSAHRELYDFACGRASATLPDELRMVEGFRMAEVAERPAHSAKLVREYGLPREAVRTEHVNTPEVQHALLEADMPIGAMIRNLGNLTASGVVKPLSDAERLVTERLGDGERLRRARVHPIQVLAAMLTYSRGRGFRGSKSWTPSPAVVDALDGAFYASFGNVEPAGKRTLLALDVSGSMGRELQSVPGLTARLGAAAMALVTAATEPQTHAIAFAGPYGSYRLARSGARALPDGPIPFPLSARERLDDVALRMEQTPFGSTDCAVPMLYAEKEGLEVDTFVVYTDNETWTGTIHPIEALRRYRRSSGIDARLAVVGMTATDSTIGDPEDPGCLDLVGFDTSAPAALAAFSRGELLGPVQASDG